MKTLHLAVQIIVAAIVMLLALPRAIGLSLLYYVDSLPKFAQFNEGAPADLKALHEATEKAFKAMQENIQKFGEMATKALEENSKLNAIEGKTAEKLTEIGTQGKKLSEDLSKLMESDAEIKARLLDVEQKAAKKHSGNDVSEVKTIGQTVAESEEYKHALKQGDRARSMAPATVGSFHKAAIVNATINTSQPLVQPMYLPGVIMPGLRRMTVRNLIPQNTTQSNLITYARELVYTNNAGPQWDATSPTAGQEGAVKNESGITFQLATAPVTTIGHWIPASRQVLQDAKMLAGYIDNRLRYGLQLEEENELMNGDGTAGALDGLLHNATAFTGGVTNQTALDTLLKAFTQVSLSYFEPDGVVLHPIDWQNILLLKDTLGRYLFSDPHGMEKPMVWGKNVVATQAQTSGQFLVGAFLLASEIFDSEDANVRVSEEHSDFFIRNMVAILAEERLAIAIYRTAAIVKGSISFAG